MSRGSLWAVLCLVTVALVIFEYILREQLSPRARKWLGRAFLVLFASVLLTTPSCSEAD